MARVKDAGGWRRLEELWEVGGICRRLDGGWTEAGKGWRTLEEAGGRWRLEARGKLEEVGGRWSCFGEAGGGWGRLQRRLEEGWRRLEGVEEAAGGWGRLEEAGCRLE